MEISITQQNTKQDLLNRVQILMKNQARQIDRINQTDQYQANLDRVLDAMEFSRGILKPRIQNYTKTSASTSRSDFQKNYNQICADIEKTDAMIDDLLDQLETEYGRASRNGRCAMIPISRTQSRKYHL